jgi:hypothetical protein
MEAADLGDNIVEMQMLKERIVSDEVDFRHLIQFFNNQELIAA